MIDGFPELIAGSIATPAVDNQFKVRDEADARKLPEEEATAFHRTVVQLLFLNSPARGDSQTSVAFLTMRVKSPDKDDWRNG